MYKIVKELNIHEDIKRSLGRIFCMFLHNDKEIYLVGGCVRDLLLGKEPKDYDLCTNATPEEVKRILDTHDIHGSKYYHFIDTGLKHGTITVHDVLDDMFYEITTYRVDGKYTDNRHPDEVTFAPSLEEDLKRRDFTINSFAYNLLTQELVMLDESFLDDLHYGIIRTVGRSTDRFTEDALRILRAFRFAAQTGFLIETETFEATKTCGHLLLNISKERIRDELTKILLSDNPRYLEFIITAGLEEFMFDGKTYITDMIKCEHQNPHHYTDVFHHTLDVIERVPKTFELRWAALFHDIGKPVVKQPRPKGPEGHYVYYGHEGVSAQIAVELMQKLKFSTAQICKICNFVRFHDMDLAHCKMSNFRKILNEIGVDNFLEFMKLREADSSAHCIFIQTKYAIDDANICYTRYKKVISDPQTAFVVTDLDISGNDLLAVGLKGKDVGEMLNKLLEIVLEKPEFNENKTLKNLVKEIMDGRRS